ncbi:hypothetical protein COK29_33835, partial [Bacillus cereus]
ELGNGQVDENGKFSVDIPKQPAGRNIGVIASNSAGTSEETIVKVKLTLPGAPEVNKVIDTDEKITGTAKPLSIITINIGSSY